MPNTCAPRQTALRQAVSPRANGRLRDAIRPIHITMGDAHHAEGAAHIRWGNTEVWCVASVDDTPPRWLRGRKQGWVTAEYAMLPRATSSRNDRKATIDSGRTREISRMIGRSLRASVNLVHLGERQIRVDCDVLNADGGTRIASLVGGQLALRQALGWLEAQKLCRKKVATRLLAAVSVGVVDGVVTYDLDQTEDQACEVDGSLVIDEAQAFVELQFSGEGGTLSRAQWATILDGCWPVLDHIHAQQREALAKHGLTA